MSLILLFFFFPPNCCTVFCWFWGGAGKVKEERRYVLLLPDPDPCFVQPICYYDTHRVEVVGGAEAARGEVALGMVVSVWILS